MSDSDENQATAIERADSDESLILMTSSLPAVISFVQETPGNLFDAPNGAALIRGSPLLGTLYFN